MFCSKLLLILNFYKHCFIKEDLWKHICIKDGVLCATEIHSLGPMDLKIYTLAKNPRL
jgi:hypothetical protein